MFDKLQLGKALEEYKKGFEKIQWPQEKYKWEAVQCFQTNWNADADDFAQMLSRSLSKTGNLLASVKNFPAEMILRFAQMDPKKVREMFIELFDEGRQLYGRIENFKRESQRLLGKYGKDAETDYQHENAISTYLWLRYPDKYYIYKLSEIRRVSDELRSDYIFRKGAYAENIRNFLAFYDEICTELQQDPELKNLLASQLTETCYPDPELRTLTVDLGFFISRYFHKKAEPSAANEWWPPNYTPNLSVDDWERLLHNREVFTDKSLEIMKRMLDYGGEATCKELSIKYGESINFYNAGSSSLASRVAKETDCPVMARNEKSTRWWTVLYLGKNAAKDKEGIFVWKLRKELEEALKRVDLSEVKLYSDAMAATNQKEEPLNLKAPYTDKYDREDFLSEVYMSEEKYERLTAVVRKKKNIILQGAPGVGKTFAAKRLAYAIMGEKDDDRIEFVQFHQNYSYEDFMMGYKPVEDGFELKYGVFYRFCQKAARNPDKDHFFIIDEINRGNLSKIFGELLMLIEADYRDKKVSLAYDGSEFSVPRCLHIIGMMNTADRSLAMIDYALRRRFSFFEMKPGFDSEGFFRYRKEIANTTFDLLIDRVQDLNKEIMKDKSLGRGFCIGHSYFCGAGQCTVEWMRDVVDFDILPMLSEYWFDDEKKLEYWENVLQGVFDDKG